MLEPQFPSEPTASANCLLNGNEGVDAASVDAFLAALGDFFGHAKGLARPMKVIVSANQVRSLSEIRPEAGGSGPAPEFTTSTYEDLFRGVYP